MMTVGKQRIRAKGQGYMDVSDLKERKKRLKLTSARLADLAGLPVSTVSKIMTGETKNPSYVTVEKLDRALSREEMMSRLKAYRDALFAYMKEHPEDPVDQRQFEKKYRREHHLTNAPLPFAVPEDQKETFGNLALWDHERVTTGVLHEIGEDKMIELLDGHLIFNEAPSLSHQMLVQKLGKKIDRFIEEHHGKCRMFNVGVNVYPDEEEETLLIPDLAILCDDAKLFEGGIMGAPDWVIEVVSESTRHRDYNEKMHKYMCSGTREYWIVDAATERVTTYIAGEPMMVYIYSFEDAVPVRIYEGALKIRMNEIVSM